MSAVLPRLRPALCILLMLITLPWGAHAGGLAAYLGAARMAAHPPPAEASQLQTQSAMGHKSCRIATLPGSACGPDILIAAAPMPPRAFHNDARPSPHDAWRATAQSPRPPHDPPRGV